MTDIAELLERVKAATGPGRELDAAIVLTLEPEAFPNTVRSVEDDGTIVCGHYGAYTFHDAPELTASIDAALALVERALPGWRWSVFHPGYDNGIYQGGKSGCHLYHPASSGLITAKGFGTTPSLAILAALLEAKEKSDE